MKNLFTLLVYLPFISSSATAQNNHYTDLELAVKAPLDKQAYFVDDTIYLDAVVTNHGPDSMVQGDSIAFLVFDKNYNLEMILGGGASNPYAHIESRVLGPGDTFHVKLPIVIAKVNTGYCFDVRPYADSFKFVFTPSSSGPLDTGFSNTIKCADIVVKQKPASVGGKLAANAVVSVFPNPAGDFLHFALDIPASGDVAIRLYDVNAHCVLETRMNDRRAGAQTVLMNTSALSKGLYFYEVAGAGSAARGRVLIE